MILMLKTENAKGTESNRIFLWVLCGLRERTRSFLTENAEIAKVYFGAKDH